MNELQYDVTVTRLDTGQVEPRTYVYRGLEPIPGGTITVTRPQSVAYPARPDDELLVRVDRIDGRRIYATEVPPTETGNGLRLVRE